MDPKNLEPRMNHGDFGYSIQPQNSGDIFSDLPYVDPLWSYGNWDVNIFPPPHRQVKVMGVMGVMSMDPVAMESFTPPLFPTRWTPYKL